MSIYITKRDGTKEPFNADKINRSIERASKGLTDPVSMVTQIATETELTLYDGMTTEEMDKATINAAVQNIKEDIEYDKVATRLLLKTVYRKVVGDYDLDDSEDLNKKHREGFIRYINEGVAGNRLHADMLKYNLEVLADTLSIKRDDLFTYAGLDGLLNRYGIKDNDQTPLETPQYLFMRIAMGLAYNEKDPTEWAKRFYNKMSRLEYLAGGSTNLAAGTRKPSLSNCFLLEIHDDMEHIAKSVSDVMLLSKGSGGIGASLTKLRAGGSPLKSNFGGASTGPTPFAKIIDTAIRAIQRGGKKKGALCFYMENWHLDFPEFIDWKHNAGDDYMRMRTANTSVFLSDEFMKRVETGQDWYMFDPAEVPDLNELYGGAFSKRYAEYIEMADRGEMRTYKRVPAAEQFRQILVALQSTSHPWLTWKDPINLRALNNNTGTIHMSNLCTEICLPQDKDNVAVCNLASLNLAAHVNNKEVNWSRLEESVRLAVRQLDNLIDINKLPIKEAAKSDQENRAVGLGVMGFSDTIEQLGMSYDSEHAWDFADRIFEFVSYMAIDESANLAQERGAYKNFIGSGWSEGKVPVDTIVRLEADRGLPVTVSRESKHKGLNWDLLRAKVKKGMRNATLMAVAPNANIGLVAGTTPGIDPRFAQIFSRNKISGKYIDINHNLVKDLKNMGIWDKVKGSIIESQGDISDVEEIPQHVRDIYKTSFTTSPYAFIEVAARAQKWVDQGLSRNMYLETRDIDETMKIYMTAWQKGVKTTYYLHMKPRHTAEQSTVSVNKAQKMGKVGFGAISTLKSKEQAPQPFQAPLQKSLDLMPEPENKTAPMDIPPPVKAAAPVYTAPAQTAPAPSYVAPAPSTPTYSTPPRVTPAVSHGAPQAAPRPASTFAAVASKPRVEVSQSAQNVSTAKAPVEQSQRYQPLSSLTNKATHSQQKSGSGFSAVATPLQKSEVADMMKVSVPVQQKQDNKPKVRFVGRDTDGPVDPAEAGICDSCQ